MVKFFQIILYFFKSYNKSSELDSDNSWIWNTKGNLLKNLKRYNEAIEWLNKYKYYYFKYSYDKLIELDSNDKLVWNIKGNLLKNL